MHALMTVRIHLPVPFHLHQESNVVAGKNKSRTLGKKNKEVLQTNAKVHQRQAFGGGILTGNAGFGSPEVLKKTPTKVLLEPTRWLGLVVPKKEHSLATRIPQMQ